MVAPVALDRVGLDHSSVSVLAQLGVWVGLELDHICAAAILESKRLDPDGADPVVPGGVLCISISGRNQKKLCRLLYLLAINVNVWGAILIRELVLGDLVLLHAVELLRRGVARGCVDDSWGHAE